MGSTERVMLVAHNDRASDSLIGKIDRALRGSSGRSMHRKWGRQDVLYRARSCRRPGGRVRWSAIASLNVSGSSSIPAAAPILRGSTHSRGAV